MEKKAEGDHVESHKKVGLLWADLHAESHCLISDENLMAGDEKTEPGIVACEEVSVLAPEVVMPPELSYQPRHDKDKSPKLKIGMTIMIMMGIGVWSWILTKSQTTTSFSSREVQVQIAGQTLMDSTPVLLPMKVIQEKAVFHVDVNQRLRETLRYMNLGKQALKERHMAKAIENFVRAKQILNSFPYTKAGFLHGELNALHANALYWQGFLALQKENQCQAKAYFVGAQAMAPHDRKIQDRLKEISPSLRC